MKRAVLMYAASVLLTLACEEVDHSGEVENPQVHVTLDEVAKTSFTSVMPTPSGVIYF